MPAGAQLGRDRAAPLALAPGFRRGKAPTRSGPSTLSCRLDATPVEAALSRWVASRLGEPAGLRACPDGKTARGSKGGDVQGVHPE